jgi:hypothetical protein
MKHIYTGQTSLRITITTAVDLSDIQNTEIRYEKPDRTEGMFCASVIDAEKGVICHDVQSADEIDMQGWWKFWAYITFNDGRSAPGQAVRVMVFDGDN